MTSHFHLTFKGDGSRVRSIDAAGQTLVELQRLFNAAMNDAKPFVGVTSGGSPIVVNVFNIDTIE